MGAQTAVVRALFSKPTTSTLGLGTTAAISSIRSPASTLDTMDAATARQMLEQGGVLVMLDVPSVGLKFKVDGASWSTGPRFKGLKMVPPGLHLVSYQAY